MTGKTVGVVGLGSMGTGIARSLLRGGLDVIGFDLFEAAQKRLADAGGRVGSRDEVLTTSDVIVVSLLNEQQIHSVLFDDAGKIRPVKRGAVVICTSTVSLDFIVSCGKALAAIGVGFLDAPVSGGPARAETGELATYLSGDPKLVEQAMFALEKISKPLMRVGDELGQGTSFKLVNQLLVAGNLVVACQAAAFSEKAGLDFGEVIKTLNGSAGDSWVLQNILPRHVARDYDPRATLALLMKDVRIIKQVSDDKGIFNPVIDFAEALMTKVAEDGRDQRDGVIIAKYLLDTSSDKRSSDAA